MQRSCSVVNSPYKRKCWTNSGGPLVNSLLWGPHKQLIQAHISSIILYKVTCKLSDAAFLFVFYVRIYSLGQTIWTRRIYPMCVIRIMRRVPGHRGSIILPSLAAGQLGLQTLQYSWMWQAGRPHQSSHKDKTRASSGWQRERGGRCVREIEGSGWWYIQKYADRNYRWGGV